MRRRRNLGALRSKRDMLLQATLTLWRRLLFALLGLFACLYALWVLWHAHSLPDVGLRSAFDPVVRRFDGRCAEIGGRMAEVPQPGDRIVSVGGRVVETWPQLLQAILALRSDPRVTISDLAQAEQEHQEFVYWGDDKWVHLTFRRPDPRTGGSVLLSSWCLVHRLPLEELVPSLLWFVLKLGLFVVGALVFWKRPTDPSARQFYLLCVVTLGAYMGGYHWSRIVSKPPLLLVFMVCAVILPAVLLHFYAIFPRPKAFLQAHPRGTLAAIYAPPVAFLIALAAGYFQVRWLVTHDGSQDEVNQALTLLMGIIYVYLVIASLWYLACVACLVHSYRASRDLTERNQVKWILVGSVVALVPIGTTLYLAALDRNAFNAGGATWPMFAASVCFTAAFTVSITRYRLMQLDQLVSSGMVYFAVSFTAGLIYYAVVFAGTLLIGSQAGPPLSQALTVSTTALVVMVLLDVARSRVKRALDRRFYREKFQLDRTLRRMSQAVEQLVDPPTLARQLLQASSEVLNVERAAVYLREGAPPLYRLAGALGDPPPLAELSPGCPLIEALRQRAAVVAPGGPSSADDAVRRQLRLLGGAVAQALSYESENLGLLVLGPKPLGQYTAEDLNLLTAFAQFAALALKSAERHHTIEGLNKDLRGKIDKISEQQRRILALQSQLMRQKEPDGSAAPVDPPAPAGGIVGSGPAMEQLLHLVKKVSASQSAVLIRGESGTGKELLARAIHENSPRAGKAFVKVHCAALSPGLLESELFGHVKGAFTNAHRDKVGRFELADGGTLFLDEIGDISLEVQTKLLRVLQEMTFERVGSSEPVEVDVRLLAATHQNLEALIRAGRFREDLFYRLNVISVAVPPLRERREDIPELVRHFLYLHGQRAGKPHLEIEDDALALLKAHAWPGNVRQLENVVERAVVIAEGDAIGPDDLPTELRENVAVGREPEALPDAARLPGLRAEREDRDRRERERLVRALAAAGGNKAEAARALGLARSTLLSRLKKHGLS
jgi:transcriptional regulator with GAF, ATPase, and Fis domain